MKAEQSHVISSRLVKEISKIASGIVYYFDCLAQVDEIVDYHTMKETKAYIKAIAKEDVCKLPFQEPKCQNYIKAKFEEELIDYKTREEKLILKPKRRKEPTNVS